VRSLREGTRAHALRRGRTCYDHLAGRLGVAVFRALIDHGLVAGGDGRHHHAPSRRDRLSARGQDVHYRLTAPGHSRLAGLGVALPGTVGDGELPLRYCVDWTEQAHHLSGGVGRALADRMLVLGWLERLPRGRAVLVTEHGRRAFPAALGVVLP